MIYELDIGDLEPSAFVISLRSGNFPSVGLDDLFDDAEPESGSLFTSRKAVTEDLFRRALGKAWSVVFDIQSGTSIKRAYLDRYGVTPMLDGISEHILEQLLDTTPVAGNENIRFDFECGLLGRDK